MSLECHLHFQTYPNKSFINTHTSLWRFQRLYMHLLGLTFLRMYSKCNWEDLRLANNSFLVTCSCLSNSHKIIQGTNTIYISLSSSSYLSPLILLTSSSKYFLICSNSDFLPFWNKLEKWREGQRGGGFLNFAQLNFNELISPCLEQTHSLCSVVTVRSPHLTTQENIQIE